ncbi:MAG: hypothetical protein HY675_26700 [Chloroflexi bacterium]|nr:hypothetical protein [Chloroflexota bacterium]
MELGAFATGVASSFVAALVFAFAAYVTFSRVLQRPHVDRPYLEIADKIARYHEDAGNNPGQTEPKKVYAIKVINKCRRPVINIKAELQLVRTKIEKGGPVQQWIDIPLYKAFPMRIEVFDKLDTQGYYAFRFRTYEDVDALWGNDDIEFLRLRVMATDSFSGFTDVFVQNYYKKQFSICYGHYAARDSFEIA